MKRIFLLLVTICLTLSFPHPDAAASPIWPSDVTIEADAGYLMDAQTGTVLYEKNAYDPYYPASITKLLTALIVLENCALDEIVEFSYDDVYNVEAGSSNAGLDEGDTLTVLDCLYALMLASANESANALARHVSGSREAFVELMNKRAASLGCTGSHFANPSGLNDEQHYTTAHDMALITREVIKNPVFLEINGSRNYKLPPTKRSPEGSWIANHHKMLTRVDSTYYPGAFAGKTGFTTLAGNTLVTCATKNSLTLICVILNGHQTHYSDTKTLLDFGFSNFRSVCPSQYETVYNSLENNMSIGGISTQRALTLSLDKEGTIVLPATASPDDIQSVLSYDTDFASSPGTAAFVHYFYDGRPIGTIRLCCDETEMMLPFTAMEIETPSEASLSVVGPNAPQPPQNTAPDFILPQLPPLPLLLAVTLPFLLLIILLIRYGAGRRADDIDLALRRQRRLERLEDMGFSVSDFDALVKQRRNTTMDINEPNPDKRKRRKKHNFFHRSR